jgi:hypothetical protein
MIALLRIMWYSALRDPQHLYPDSSANHEEQFVRGKNDAPPVRRRSRSRSLD